MNKELVQRLETMISTAKHICTYNIELIRNGNLAVDAMHIYLLEKIEALEYRLEKFENKKNKKV